MTDTEAASSAEHLCSAPACRRHPAAGWNLCRAHAAKLGQWLADVEDLYATLDAVPSSAVDLNHAHGSVLAAHRSPARMDVLVLRDVRSREQDDEDPDGNHGRGVLEVLGSWARIVREARDLAAPDKPATVTSERGILVAHLDWCLSQDWVDELYADVRAVWALLKSAHGERAPKPQARCWVPQEDGSLCGGPIWADPGAAWCGTCRTSWSGADLLRISSVLRDAA